MTDNDMIQYIRQVRFENLVQRMDYKFNSRNYKDGFMSDENYLKFFNETDYENTPLCLFFDAKTSNGYRKSILKVNIFNDYLAKKKLSNSPNNNLQLLKEYIAECRKKKECAIAFVFWALLAVGVDKTNYDEKISMIADFTHMVEIGEDALSDIIQAVKMVLGETHENINFRNNKVSSYFSQMSSVFEKKY